jgi:pimeloyl-ACP methyl ester carboxylesterase
MAAIEDRVREIEARVVDVDGVRCFYRRVPGDGPPTIFLHGNPSHSEDWVPFMRRLQGPALAPDLPGFGFSENPPRSRFDYSMHGLATFFERFCDRLGVGDHSLVVHDWGAIGLIAAQRRPERVRRLVVINAVPLLPGYRWHWVARYFWRVPVAGELANLTTTKAGLRLLSRQASATPGGLPPAFIDSVWAGRGQGSWPEMLELYRKADPERLAAAGEELGAIDCPALVVWGRDDLYLPVRFGRAYAEALPGAELLELERAGHWPWLDRPDSVDRVIAFLAEPGPDTR